MKPDSVKLVHLCEHCNESTALVINRKQAKAILKAFNKHMGKANVTLENATHG